MSGVEINTGELCDCGIEINLEPAGGDVDGLMIQQLYIQNAVSDMYLWYGDNASHASPTTFSGGNGVAGAMTVIPTGGSYTAHVFVLELSDARDYDVSVYRECATNLASSTLVGTQSVSGSTVGNVVELTFPTTTYASGDLIIVRFTITAGGTLPTSWGAALVLDGCPDF